MTVSTLFIPLSKNEPLVGIKTQLKVRATTLHNEPMVTNEKLRAEFASRLKQAILDSGMPLRGAPVRMHEVTGMSPNAAGKWLKGEAMPGPANMRALCEWLNVREEWLEYGRGSQFEAEFEVAEEGRRYLLPGDANLVAVSQPQTYYSYPVISSVQAGAWSEAIAPYEPGDEPHKEGTDYRARGPAFWLEVKGDSMTAPHGASPSITEGTLVLFDTGLEAVPGKLVVAQLEGAGEATFKQLIEDGGQRYLKALNPAYPLIPVNGNCRILGVAVETKMRL